MYLVEILNCLSDGEESWETVSEHRTIVEANYEMFKNSEMYPSNTFRVSEVKNEYK